MSWNSHRDDCHRSLLEGQERITREEKRWEQMERKEEVDNEQWNRMREEGEKARKNKSGLPYNMITLR